MATLFQVKTISRYIHQSHCWSPLLLLYESAQVSTTSQFPNFPTLLLPYSLTPQLPYFSFLYLSHISIHPQPLLIESRFNYQSPTAYLQWTARGSPYLTRFAHKFGMLIVRLKLSSSLSNLSIMSSRVSSEYGLLLDASDGISILAAGRPRCGIPISILQTHET